MDVSAADHRAGSDLDIPVEFWEEFDRIVDVDRPGGDQQEGGSSNGEAHSEAAVVVALLQERITRLLVLCNAWYDTHIDNSTNCDEVVARLFESSLFKCASNDDISDALVIQLSSPKTLPALHLLFVSLFYLGTRHPEVYQSKLAVTQLIPRLVHHFWAARYAEEYLEREAGRKDGNGEAGGYNHDWNIKHVRNISMGNAKKQREQARDRKLQSKLRDESVILLYEVCRAQRLELADLRSIDTRFVNHLFDLVEASRHWHDDSYNYQLIKLIVALNEQFMVSGIDLASSRGSHLKKGQANQSNIVMTVLSTRLNASNTFGENLIWMLNRASNLNAEDVCMQLLVLKLLYLLFTTRETAHYLYTNDLKVLVDVFIRELSDLPEDSESLRHTYLRVLHPLLTNTQLLTYPYKRDQIRQLLLGLTSNAHLRDISPTIKRLVDRCLNAQWCVDLDDVDAKKIAEGKTSCSIEQETHTFTVQTIAGGPKKFVQAPVVYDGEGIKIPMGAHHVPYQGAPSSTSSTFAVAATYLPDRTGQQSPTSTTTPLPQQTFQTPTDEQIDPINGGTEAEAQIYPDAPNEEDPEDRNGRGVAATLADTSLLSGSGAPSAYPTRRERGQRSLSARSAPMSPSQSVTSLNRAMSQEVQNKTARSGEWSGDSDSSHWPSGRAETHHCSSPTVGAPNHYGSPLSHESTEQYFTLSKPPLDQYSSQVEYNPDRPTFEAPTLQVMQVLEDEGIIAGKTESNSSHSSNTSAGTGRRRPPAPPRSENGDLTSRREKRAMLSSTSESNLATPSATSSSMSAAGRREKIIINTNPREMNSLPSSPRPESVDSSRASSPTLDNALSSRRRRPPPPPVNRSTKGSRIPTFHQQLHTSQLASISTKDPYTNDAQNLDDEQTGRAHQLSNNGQASAEHVDEAMKYLYVSENGYGW